MQRKLSASVTALLMVAFCGCSRPAGNPAPTAQAGSPTPTAAAAAPALDSRQVEALAYLAALSEHEVAAAEQVRGKRVDVGLRAFADRLHAEHSRSLEQTMAVASRAGVTIGDSTAVKAMRAAGQAELERLAALDEDDYAAAYLEAMTLGHAKAQELIDQKLLPAATSAPVREHLVATRAEVLQHLEGARALKAPKK